MKTYVNGILCTFVCLMSVESGLHPHRRRSMFKDESPRSGLRPSHTLQGSRSRSDYGIVSHVQRLEEQRLLVLIWFVRAPNCVSHSSRKLSDYGLLPPVVLPCVQISTVSLASSSKSTNKIERGHSWKNRFRWGFSAPNVRSSLAQETDLLNLPSTSADNVSVQMKKSKSITFCVPTQERSVKSARSSVSGLFS
ncbi:unnamed protein product [Cylicocyclus nassatus]|uniref:Uncharacterized protein n=1 Tax=Cylicocyclus nassatus TaxID=53992 RepID=A0AA36HEQ2_CYLNA|nr:unnamed protein product [Cylicocyclus nassatus]